MTNAKLVLMQGFHLASLRKYEVIYGDLQIRNSISSF